MLLDLAQESCESQKSVKPSGRSGRSENSTKLGGDPPVAAPQNFLRYLSQGRPLPQLLLTLGRLERSGKAGGGLE